MESFLRKGELLCAGNGPKNFEEECGVSQPFRYAAIGAAAGAVTGILGSGGGLVLVPLLSAFCAEDEATLFLRSLSIMLPICVCSLLVQYRASPPPLPGMLPYLIGGALGGSLSAFIGKRVPLVWLHRFFGLILLWSGFRCLFL